MNIVCIGDCGVDHYLPHGTVRCGGITANFALHAREAFPADDTITIISAIGSDPAAAVVQERLRGAGIELRITSLEGTTSVQYIEIEPDGEKNFVSYDEGVLAGFEPGEPDRTLIGNCDLLVMPVFRQIHDFFERTMAIDRAGLTAVDFADFREHPEFSLLEAHIQAIDVGFFGLSAGDAALTDALRLLAATRDRLLVVTLGTGGSRAFHGSRTFECAAVPVARVVDTTGAGDAFAAGFLSRYCYGGEVGASLEAGAARAARIIQRIGTN